MKKKSTPTINQFVSKVKLEPFDNSMEFVEKIAEDIVDKLDLTVVKKTSHSFTPSGVTLVNLLSQSHLVIHTWPESGIVHIDLVMCSQCSRGKFEDALAYALRNLDIKSVETKIVDLS